MDKSVPLAAAEILEFIGKIEAPEGYVTLYNNKHKKRNTPITSMTLAQIINAGRSWTAEYKSSACGRYQFMNATLKGLRDELGLSGSEVFSPDFQDRLAYHLLKRRGYTQWANGALSDSQFMINLAKEWASFPVPHDMKGAHRNVKKGETYYAGDELNKSLIKPEQVLACLARAKVHLHGSPTVAPTPQPYVPPEPPAPVDIPVSNIPGPVPEPVTKPQQPVSFWNRLAMALAILFKKEA